MSEQPATLRKAHWVLALLGRAGGTVLGAAASSAVGVCPGASAARVLCSGCGVLESVIVARDGRLFFTSQTWKGLGRGALLGLEAPGERPVPVATGIDSPGGLALADDGRLLVGFGDSPQGGLVGNMRPRAGLLLIDPDTGERDVWVRGLGMANGVVRADDGAVYASNDFGRRIERVEPDGSIDRGWASVWSANGLALDPAGRHLYATQTFTRAAVKRIELADPRNVTTHAKPPWPARAALLDGLACYENGRLYAAANGAGQIWRIEPNGEICVLARGLRMPSAVALGRGSRGFHAGNAYVVTFAGDLIELPGDAS